MEKLFRNPKLNVSVRIVKSGEEVLFYAKDVAESLGYTNPQKAVRDHVWKTNRTTVGEFQRVTDSFTMEKSHPDTVLLYEPGLYQLVCNSRLPIAEEFQGWVLPSIRKIGSYKLPESEPLYCKQMKLINETDLHYAVVEYLKKYHPKALILPGLGEYQDTSQKRCDAWRKGYMGGQPDLTIVTPSNGFHGFAIELKSPKGTGEVRDNQASRIKELGKTGYRTLISNDYTKIVLDIEEYFRVDRTKKLLREIKNLKIKCKTLKDSKCKEVVIRQIGYTVGKY
ncbi:Hypothetical predicted protein [Paramuricea clavata]|uniref:Uncharacterized protein n=1 Tax=Paramuricea clavata TaxID=317549 RepID=A0A6S7GHF5_PARCT|nr:Hypothetical predicted protein [Paramuricea clavata]